MEQELTIRAATEDDVEAVVALVHDTAVWLRERNIPQWQVYLKPTGLREIRYAVMGAGGREFFVAFDNEQLVGTCCIQWNDVDHWDARGNDSMAGYIHTLAVARRRHHCRIGQRMLRFAEQLIASRNKPLSRLDCSAANAKLVNYYRLMGYAAAGTKGEIQQFEKRVRAAEPG